MQFGKILAGISLICASSAQAGNFVCTGGSNDFMTLKVEGRLVTDWIKNIKATTTSQHDELPSTVGRSSQIDKDEDYHPTRYTHHSRFDLSKLTEVRGFGKFMPVDECHIYFLIPENAMKKDSFKAPVIANCDQSGGSFTLDCDHDRSVD